MTGWTARVWADRDHYDLVRARGAGRDGDDAVVVPDFPAEPREFTVELVGDEVSIGRRPVPDEAPATPPESVPGIDLTGPPRDPGVSRLHAVLLAVGDDRWVVLDAGSTNGTTLNYGAEPLVPGTAVPLDPGDAIHVGAWTTITVGRR